MAKPLPPIKRPIQPKEPPRFRRLAQIRGQIVDPPKSSGVAAVLLLGLIIILGLAVTNPPSDGRSLFCPAILLLLPLAVGRQSLYVMHFNIFLAFCYLMYWFPHFANYPFSELTPLLLYGYTVVVIPGLRQSVGWIRTGKFDKKIWLLIGISCAFSSTALVAWVKSVNPDLSHYSILLSGSTAGMVLLNGVLFCTLNAAEEEIIWRGIMMEALDSAFGPGILSIIIQAASFATAHYLNGFPNGLIGSLIVFVCGCLLGVIRRKSKGLAACWLAHAVADFTIYCLIYYFLRSH